MEKERDLVEIMQELAQYTELRTVTPLIIEYQHLMGQYKQNHHYVIGLMTTKYTPKDVEYQKHLEFHKSLEDLEKD